MVLVMLCCGGWCWWCSCWGAAQDAYLDDELVMRRWVYWWWYGAGCCNGVLAVVWLWWWGCGMAAAALMLLVWRCCYCFLGHASTSTPVGRCRRRSPGVNYCSNSRLNSVWAIPLPSLSLSVFSIAINLMVMNLWAFEPVDVCQWWSLCDTTVR
jgi:hypothetical protein